MQEDHHGGSRNNNGSNDQEELLPGLYAVDMRIFFATITIAMAISFTIGMHMAPIPVDLASVVTMMDENNEIKNAQPFHLTRHGENQQRQEEQLQQQQLEQEDADGGVFTEMSEDMIASNQVVVDGQKGDDDDDSSNHLPAGQHLLVDMKGVCGDFLNSEERLSKAMVDTVKDSGLTMLSYHCHALLPSGVSCIGVLLESHISFHTWPEQGVITLDLFTCGSQPLLPVIPTIKRLFGVPPGGGTHDDKTGGNSGTDKIQLQWSHELRGFRPPEEARKNYLADWSDLSAYILSPLEIHSKEEIYGGTTKFQRVDIWDVVDVTDTPSYKDVEKHNMTETDPRLKGPEFVTPDRQYFLDGMMVASEGSERIYNEAAVHPAMFAHKGPKRVAVWGGSGIGSTIREVLKHKTVEVVKLFEQDQELEEITKKHLNFTWDCSDFVGRSDVCGDDEIVQVSRDDAKEWFSENFLSPKPNVELFDVIILEAMYKRHMFDATATQHDFFSSVVNALSEEGVLVIPIGRAATIDEPRPDVGLSSLREALFRLLESLEQIQTMLVYEEPHSGFEEPYSFMVVCKSSSCRSRWYARSDQVDYEIYDRIVRTHSKVRALTYFDGTTQRSYQWPKKGWETVYCRREPQPFECAYRTIDPNAQIHEFILPTEEDDEDEGESSFRYEISDGDNGKKISSLYATVDIPKGSFVMAEHLASSLMVTSRNLQGLESNLEVSGAGRVAVIADLLEFFEQYAHPSAMEGSGQHYVELGATCLMRRVDSEASANVGRWMPAGKRPKYSPVYERHRMSFDVFLVATKDIAKDGELLLYEKTW